MATQTASTTMETLTASATEFCQLGSKKVVEDCVPMTAQLDPPGFSPQFFEPPAAERGDPPPQEAGDSSSLVTVSIESASLSALEPPPPQPAAAAPQTSASQTTSTHPPDWEWLQQHLKKKESSQTTTTTAAATPVTPAAQQEREEPPPVTPSRAAKNFSLKDPSPRRSLRLQRLRGRSSSTTTSGSVASSTTTPKRDHLHNNTNHTTNTMMMMIQRRPAEVSPDKAPAEPVTVVPSPARRAQVQVKNHENNNDDDASTVVSAVQLNPLPPVSSPAPAVQAVPVVSATSQTTRSPRPPINLITQQQQQQQLSEQKPQEPTTTSTFSNSDRTSSSPPLIKAQAMCSAMANPMAKCVDRSCQYCHSMNMDWNQVTCPLRPPPLQFAKQQRHSNNSQFPCGMAIVMQDEEDTYYDDDDDDGYFYGETSTVDSTTVSSSSLETPYHHKPRQQQQQQRRQQPYHHHPGTDSTSGSTALTQHDEIMTPQRRQPIVTTHRILSTPPSSLPRTDVVAVRLQSNVTKPASKALLAAASPVLDDAMEWNARDRVWVLDYSTHPASDWELIQLYLQPRSLGSLPLSFKTIPTLLPWCRHLKLTGLLQDVDQFVFSWIIHCTSAETNQGEVPLPLNSLLALTKIAYACGWTLTMAQTRQWLKHKLLHPNKKSSSTDNHNDNDNELEWSLTELLQLLLLLSEYEGLREYLWECVEAYLPPDLETSLEKHSHALTTNHLTVYLLRDGMMQATMAERASALVQQWKETSMAGNKQQEVEHFHSILSVAEDGDDSDNDDDTLTVFTTVSSQPGSLRIKIPRDQEGPWNVAKLHEWFQDIIVAMRSFEQRQQKLAHQQKASSRGTMIQQQHPHQDRARAPILRQSADARKNKQRFEC